MNKKEIKMLKREFNLKDDFDKEVFETIVNGDLSAVITPIS